MEGHGRIAAFLGGCALLAFLLFVGPAGVWAQDVIDLGDIVAGGDGTGTAPPENIGINADTGLFEGFHMSGHIPNTGLPTEAVDDSEFIDSVFIIALSEMEITQSGVIFEFPLADVFGQIWDHILKDRNPDADRLLVGGVMFDHGVGIHAAAGITFDLDALRTVHGADAVGYVSAYAGMDDCGSGDINLYMILSDEFDVIDSITSHAFPDEAELLELDIPPEAKYLTLATGSNGGDACDHGSFANAWIRGEAPEEGFSELRVTPESALLSPGWTLSLTAEAIDAASGIPVDVTAEPETTYASADDGVAEVSEEGIVTAMGTGSTTITVANGDLSAEVSIVVLEVIDLGNIAAGGNGKTPREELEYIGINADDGQFVLARLNAAVPNTGENPQEVFDSELIESVFVLNMPDMDITTTGIVYDFDPADTGDTWDVILNGWENDEVLSPEYLEIGPLGRFYHGLGIHANAGITFDLDAIREEHGAEAVRYVSAYAGDASARCIGTGTITAYVLVSDETDVIDEARVGPVTDDGEFVQLELPPEARFVTFAVGGAGDGIGCDHGAFGDAFITGCDITDPESCEGPGPGPGTFGRGDIDANGSLTIGDAIGLLNYQFAGGVEPKCLDACDIDDSGTLTIGDAIWLLNYQFAGDKPPAAPGPGECGEDPTADDLDCASFPPCAP